MRFLRKDMVPEVTSPSAMLDAVDFFLVSAHGATDLRRFMIVPENTFVVYLAHSGFVRYLDRDLNKFKELLNPAGFAGGLEGWADAYYKNFFTGQSKSLQFYPNAAIYCPGDLLPDTALSFRSGTQDIWFKGVYSLPVETDQVSDFTLERNLVYEIADWVKDGTLSYDYILNVAKLKPYKSADFIAMTEASLTEEGRIARFGKSPQLKDWFDNVDGIVRDFDNSLFYLAEGNLAKEAPIEGLHLSEVLENIKGSKPYRFFFFTGCRGPLVPGSVASVGASEPDPDFFKWSRPANIPLNLPAAASRRVARRFSFSAKCDLGKKPALNLNAARMAFVKLLTDKESAEELRKGAYEEPKMMLRFFKENFLGHEFRFTPAPTPQQIAILLNLTYEEILPETAAALPKYVEFVEELRETFAEFTLQLRRESPTNVRALVVGDMFKATLGIPVGPGPNPAKHAAALRGEVASHAKVIEREYDVFKKEMDALLKSYEDAYKGFRDSLAKSVKELEERLHRSIVRARNEENSEKEEPVIQQAVEEAYVSALDHGKALRDAFDAAQLDLVQRHFHLGDRVFEYRYEDTFEMIEKFDRYKRLMKPFQDMINRLVDRSEERMRGKTKGGSRRGRGRHQTRRLRR